MMRTFGTWRMTYGREGLRRLGEALVAVPLVLRALWHGRRSATAVLKALLAVPVAVVSTALAGMTAYLHRDHGRTPRRAALAEPYRMVADTGSPNAVTR